MSLKGSKPSYWDWFPKGTNPIYPTPLIPLIQPPPAQPTPTTKTTKHRSRSCQQVWGGLTGYPLGMREQYLCACEAPRQQRLKKSTPRYFWNWGSRAATLPGASQQWEEPGAALADSGAWESLRELSALGTDDDIGQQLPSQVPSGAGQGPTGFSQ